MLNWMAVHKQAIMGCVRINTCATCMVQAFMRIIIRWASWELSSLRKEAEAMLMVRTNSVSTAVMTSFRAETTWSTLPEQMRTLSLVPGKNSEDLLSCKRAALLFCKSVILAPCFPMMLPAAALDIKNFATCTKSVLRSQDDSDHL